MAHVGLDLKVFSLKLSSDMVSVLWWSLENDDVTQHDAHSPANTSTEACSLGSQRASSLLSIHVTVNLHSSKQDIR